ncbi:MAG: 3-keto-5-aminohexanoate cleavage protein [Solirubrobacteraceae bacterium]
MDVGPRARAHVPHPLRPYDPLIVNAALTGMVPTRARVPHVPVTPEQIVDDAIACVDAGATILHLHARRADESPAWERAAYEAIIPGIRAQRPDAVICVSTSGRDVAEFDRRADVLELSGDARPDMASLTLGSLTFRTSASVNAPDTIVALAERMTERGIRPELEIFDSGMAYLAAELLDRGVLEPPLYANLILGSINTARSLAHLVDALPPGTTWAAGGFGPFQLPMTAMAIFMGGHVRTGLEDNPAYDAERTRPATNPGLVARAAELAAIAGRPLATARQAREPLGLS